jgi:hypothetical protein
MSKHTVLFIEWASSGRDFEIALPTMYFFEHILGWNVILKPIFDLPGIYKTKPDIIVMSNTTGAVSSFKMAKLINESGFYLFSHNSEGFIRENAVEEMVWGWNSDKILYENVCTYWSEKSYLLARKFYPEEVGGKGAFTGSILHDKYKLFSSEKKIKSNYKKIITYASFDFVNVLSKTPSGKENPNAKYVKIINGILSDLISQNPDVLFVGKKHPGDGVSDSLEFKGLNDKFENFIIVSTEYSIFDLAKQSEVWLSFRSSTNLEAWLLETPTISFCEEEVFVTDSEFVTGSIQSIDSVKVSFYIQEILAGKKIPEYDEKEHIRKTYIKNLIEYSDGLNHVRFMSMIKPYIQDVESGKNKVGAWDVSTLDIIFSVIRHTVYKLFGNKYQVPFFRRYALFYGRYNKKEVHEQMKLRYADFSSFYEKNSVTINETYQNFNK